MSRRRQIAPRGAHDDDFPAIHSQLPPRRPSCGTPSTAPNLKFLWNSKGSHLLFDLEKDPRETVNLVGAHAQRAAEMAARLDEYLNSLPEPGPAVPAGEVDQQTQEALESLGYLE